MEVESGQSERLSQSMQTNIVILVMTDDQGQGDVRSQDNPLIDTPNLDRLAQDGARFKNFFVSPLCAPTRARLLTGRYHIRTGTVDGQSFLPLSQGKSIPWRDYFLYVYYWEQNYPQTPTHFCLRGDQYKYTTYYGLWDTDELFDIQADPKEQNNLIHDPAFAKTKQQMQSRLYEMMEELGGMEIPMNPPRGRQQNKRLRSRNGVKGADFPEAMVVDEPLREIK